MYTFSYTLSRADYMDWVKREAKLLDNPSIRRKYYFIAVFSVMAVLLGEYYLFPDSRALFNVSCVFGLVVLIGVFGILSERNRLNSIYIRYGFKNVEKMGNFPTITMKLTDDKMTLSSDKSGVVQTYRYRQISVFEESPRLFMLQMDDGTWQFIAKRCFTSARQALNFAEYAKAKRSGGQGKLSDFMERED